MNNNILSPNTITVFDFISKLDNDKTFEYFLVPELQRNLAWSSKKIYEILNSKEEFNFFGTITILKKSGKFLVVDGQQRLSFFILCYNIASGIKKEMLLMTENLADTQKPSFKKLYGNSLNDFLTSDVKSEEYKKVKESLDSYGYLVNFNAILEWQSSNKDKLVEFLKKCHISLTVHNSETAVISEYEMFINMNSKNVELQKSNLVKGILLKFFKDKHAPTSVNNEWKEIVRNCNIMTKSSKKYRLMIFWFAMFRIVKAKTS